jgi:SAM-dependent methyltransferase
VKPLPNEEQPCIDGRKSADSLRLYSDLASWFPLLTPPGEYAEEAEIYHQVILKDSLGGQPESLLELGSGGGHNAFHLKAHFRLTLVDISSSMLETSRQLNPECEHWPGDMRTVRLGQEFDAVLIQDAVSHMNNEADLRAAVETAFAHCRRGGVALFCPDFTKETFTPGTSHGGVDGDGRAIRYLEWTWDPDPADDWYYVDFAYLLREGEAAVRVSGDRHVLGLFPRAMWEKVIRGAGFEFFAEPFLHSTFPDGSHEIFIGRKP